MKKCPFCSEQVQDSALKCPHCFSVLKDDKQKWYFKTSFIVISFLCVGPLALPLVWLHPKYTIQKKTIITVIVLVASYFLLIAFSDSLKVISKYYNQVFQIDSLQLK